MKIFVDTNIFLDLIFQREGYQEAAVILNSCEQNLLTGYIADITLLNIDYVARKQIQDVSTFLKVVNTEFIVTGADNKLFDQAFELDNKYRTIINDLF